METTTITTAGGTVIKVTSATGSERIEQLRALIERNAMYLTQDRFDEQGRIALREQNKAWEAEIASIEQG